MATCNASSLLTANPFTRLDKGLQEACKLQLLCDISANGGGGGGGITGSGTINTIPLFTGATALGNSILTQSGSTISVAGGITQTGQLVINRGALTGAASPSIDITGTWNNAATTFTSISLNMTDTASASGSLLINLQVGGSSRFSVNKAGTATAVVFTAGNVTVNNTGGAMGFSDAFITRDGVAGTLSQRNSTNAQSFRVYKTFTSSTNHERGVLDWQTTTDLFRIGTEKGSGGGLARDMVLVTDATERLRCDVNGNVIVNTGAIATNATNGFLYVPSCAGTPTGVPTTFTGRVPIVVDTTNNKLYFYSGAAWRDAGP